MPTNLPGGKVLSSLSSYTNVINPLNGAITHLDVSLWDTDEDVKTGPNRADSGSNAYPIRRVTGIDSAISLHIWWAANNSPRSLLNFAGGWGCALQLAVSNLPQYQMYGYTSQQFFVLLSGIMKKFKVRANSGGGEGEEGIIIADAIVYPNATRLILLPDESAYYTQEVARLQALGQLTPLAQFGILQT